MGWLLPAPAAKAAPRAVALTWVDPPGAAAAATEADKLATQTLRALTSLQIIAVPPSAWAACARDAACLLAKGRDAKADAVLALHARGGARLVLEARWVEDGRKTVARQLTDVPADELEGHLRPLVESVLPADARRGFGGVHVPNASGVVVKVDGRPTVLPEGRDVVIPLTASSHSVDVLYPDGRAVLQQLSIEEGARAALTLGPPPVAVRESRFSTLRGTSYGLWIAGTLAIAGSLLAGAASRQAAAGLGVCEGLDRSCLSFDEARRSHRRASAYATTGNVLLGVGGALSAAGAGLFVFDLTSEGRR